MRIRVVAPLLAALVAATATAQAGDCGAAKYASAAGPVHGDHNCFTNYKACNRTCYKLVYDTVVEKRWHTCYQTVEETVMKPVCKTCYREECKTCYKTVYDTHYKTVQQTCYKSVPETTYRQVKYKVCKPTYQTVMKEVVQTVCRPFGRNAPTPSASRCSRRS
jgi:hypothetical protein